MPEGKPPNWSTIVWTGVVVAAAVSILVAINGGGQPISLDPLKAQPPVHDAAYEAEVKANSAAAASVDDRDTLNWQYNSETDALGHHTLSACTESSNSVSLHWPYHETKAMLCLQDRSGHRFTYLHTEEKSQMLCSSYDGCSVPVRYDSDPAGKTTFYEPSDYDSSYLLTRGISKRLLTSKQMVVGPTFFEDGQQEFVFDTRGLDLSKVGYAPHFSIAKSHRE